MPLFEWVDMGTNYRCFYRISEFALLLLSGGWKLEVVVLPQ